MLNVFGELLKKELGSGLMSSRTREGNASNLFVVWQLESFLLLSLETIYFLLMLASFLRCFCSVPALELSRSAGCDLQTHRLWHCSAQGWRDGQCDRRASKGNPCVRVAWQCLNPHFPFTLHHEEHPAPHKHGMNPWGTHLHRAVPGRREECCCHFKHLQLATHSAECRAGDSYATLPTYPFDWPNHHLGLVGFVLWPRFTLDGKPNVSSIVTPGMIYALSQPQQWPKHICQQFSIFILSKAFFLFIFYRKYTL